MKKLLIITPHLSTGGAPQVTVNKIELIKNDFEIKVIEHSFLAWAFVVQRNKIIELVGNNNFISLGSDKHSELVNFVEAFQPDIISMEEFPEMFLEEESSRYLYRNDRTYTILETTHDSSFNPRHKRYFPDKFIFVSPYSAFKYIDLDVPTEIIEYPVDKKTSDKISRRDEIGLEHDYFHIVTVGLFTARKNQKYAFELAERLYKHKIKFHFLGNQAGNFEHYWKPLMEWKNTSDKMNNVVVWGERNDVPKFVEACDLFLFPSRGGRVDKELNPIAIKEAMEYNIPKLMYNLDVYCNKYNNQEDVFYLTGDVETDSNKILEIFNIDESKMEEELVIVGTYPNLKERVKLTKECIKRLKTLGRKVMVVSHYPVDEETQRMADYYVYDAHNPLTHHSYYNRFYNHTHFYDAELYINALKNSNQSLTVLTNLFNAFKSAKNLGYKRAFYLTFDYLLHPDDRIVVEESFKHLQEGKKAYLSTLNTPFGKGIQTNGMSFDVDFFLSSFDDVRTPDKYNSICSEIGAQNFLEDYMIKVVNQFHENSITLINNDKETFLVNSGDGASSNSEYYSILPIKNKHNHFMLYFFSYNLDERKLNITIHEDGNEIFNNRIQINKNREYKKDFEFRGKPLDVILEFYDGDNIYKTDKFPINSSNVNKYRETGEFRWKNQKPKIKLVQIQVSNDDERQKQSRETLQKVKEYGWEYVLHTNKPYSDLPPKSNCLRPNCVSLTLFDDQRVAELGTALTPAHYGCYESFKNAILAEFTNDVDFLMVCEGDCILECSVQEFVSKVEASCPIMEDNNIGYMSFGDKDTLEHGWLQSPVVEEIPNTDLLYITNHIIGIQSIMFPHFTRSYLKEKLRLHPWDASDTYFNIIMGGSGHKFGIVKERLTSQADGFSLIDNTIKQFRKR